mgnify:CR=1 FL=1
MDGGDKRLVSKRFVVQEDQFRRLRVRAAEQDKNASQVLREILEATLGIDPKEDGHGG